MSFIPAYLAAGIEQPDFDLRVIPIFQFPDDERRCLEWFNKAQKARRVGQTLVQSGLELDAERRRGIVAAVTGQPALDPGAKRELGIDTSHYRVPGFLLIRTVASAPNGSLNGAIRVASESCPKMSKETIGRLWRDHMPIAHFGAALWWCRRDFLRSNPRDCLEWAESLRAAGEKHRSPHTRRHLLDPKRTVKMPSSLGLRTVPLDLPPAEEIKI